MNSSLRGVSRSTGFVAYRGFTLIELLVVIAIIGILAAIILASLSTAKEKGQDAAVQEELGQMRSQAELYTGTMTAFSAANCSSATTNFFGKANYGIGTILAGVSNALGGFTAANSYCYAAAGTLPSAGGMWAVAAALPSGDGYWCSDYTGASRSQNSADTAYASLDGTGATAAFNTTKHQCN